MTYDQLPDLVRKKFDSYEVDFKVINYASLEQIEEIFKRLNNGTALSKIELTRAVLGEVSMPFLNKMSNRTFFKNYVGIGGRSKNRFADQELILQLLMILAYDGAINIGSKDYMEHAAAIHNAGGVPEEMAKRMNDIVDYMEKAFEPMDKPNDRSLSIMLKKVHVVGLFPIAELPMESDIDPVAFGLWAK